MTASFLATLASVFLVAGGATFFSRRRLCFPLVVVLALGFLATFAAARLPWTVSAGLSLLFCTIVLRGSSQGRSRFPRAARIFMLLPCLLVLGNAWIAERNGWHLSEAGASPHFRFPFNDDVERNVVLVEALARGSDVSPYLAHSRLNYQVYWHSLASLFVSGEDAGPSVAGVARATGLVFFLFVTWLLFALRPAWAARGKLAAPLLCLLFFHADIYNFLVSLLLYGRPGIEADWSVGRASIYRYVSFAFLELASPQHLFFFLFATASLAVTYYRRRLRLRNAKLLAGVFSAFAFLASPILFLVLFPPLVLWETARRRSFLPGFHFLVGSTAAGVAYVYVFRHSPLDLIFREAVTTYAKPPPLGWGWLLAPAIAITSLGVLGLGAMVWGTFSMKSRAAWKHAWLAYLVAGLLFFNYLITSPEIKRHFGWIALVLFLFHLVDTAGRRNLRRLHVPLAAVGALALGLHVYFLYSFLAKPSVVPATTAWGDYFEMNRQIKARYPEIPVIAAVSSDFGIVMSPLVRATSTFSLPSHAMIHSTTTPEQRRWLGLAKLDTTTVPYAKPLGYEAILWDDIAAHVWGDAVKERFIDERNLLLRAGKLSLYRLVDKLDVTDKSKRAALLAAGGWHFEAVHAYNALLKEKPSALLHQRLSESLYQLGAKGSAAHHAQVAKSLEKK